MLTDDCSSRRPLSGRRLGAALVAGLLLLAACHDGGSGTGSDDLGDRPGGPNAAPLPTIEGGVELAVVDPTAVLVADGLAFGQPLPSEQVAADAFTEDPEVSSAIARRVYSVGSGRLVANVIVLVLDGKEIFDEGVLSAFVRGVIGGYGDGTTAAVSIADRPTYRSRGPARTAHGFRDGDLVVVATAPVDSDATLVVERQLAARAAGVVGGPDPVTPMVSLPIGAAFVTVPTVTFQPIPPPEEEPPPVPPAMAGATAVEGRYGVVAGERRTVIWSFTVDPATYPSAEALQPAMAALVSARSGGSPAETVEVLDRVVLLADAAPEVEGALSARVFRQGALVLLVEGTDAAQVDAVVSDWISVLAAAARG